MGTAKLSQESTAAHDADEFPGFAAMDGAPPRLERFGFAAVGATFLCLSLFVAVNRNINWDEFNFLAQIYAYDRARLTVPLQTFHVHLLRWIVWLPMSEVSQIVVGRLVFILLQLGTCAAIAAISLGFFSRRITLLVVASYLATGFAVEHGASFRTDVIVAFLLMGSLAILFRMRLAAAQLVVAAILASVAVLVSIKASLYLPAFLAAFAWRVRQDGLRSSLTGFVLLGLVFLASTAALWALHVASLATVNALAQSASNADSALQKTVLSQGLFPRAHDIAEWMLQGFVPQIAILAGILAALLSLGRKGWDFALVVLLLAAPLACLVIYRNAFPYFFPFLLPPVVLASGLAYRRIEHPAMAAAIYVLILATLVVSIPRYAGKDQQAQRETIAAAKAAFPGPTPYIDRAGMIASYPKVGFFMSTWGMEGAIASGRDMLSEAIHRHRPRFVLANSDALHFALEPATAPEPRLRLSGNDERLLRENYIHHWGAIWVAGKELEATPEPRSIELLIGGTYTIECASGQLRLDGKPRACGTTVILPEGRHTVSASAPVDVVLRIGAHLQIPDRTPSQGLLFYPL